MKVRSYLLVAVFVFFGLVHLFPGMVVVAAETKAKERLAVLDLEVKHGVEKSFAEALSGIIRDKLHSYGDYQVMSTEDIRAVASREQLQQAMGGDDGNSQRLLDFGRTIGTRFMVAGDISKLGSTYMVSLRMLDTKGEGAGVVNRVSETCKCEEDGLIVAVKNVAAKLVGKTTLVVTAKSVPEEVKKPVDVKKPDEERRKPEGEGKKRVAEEKKKIDDPQKLRQVAETEEFRKMEEEKQRFIAELAKLKKEKEWIEAKPHTDPITGMEFALVPGGCFEMGQTEAEKEQLLKSEGNENYHKFFANELPRHEVCVDGFQLGIYEVTVGEWRTFITATGYRTDAEKNNMDCYGPKDNNWADQKGYYWGNVGFPQTDRQPVACVSHNDAMEFIRWLRRQSGRNFRLPTEAEWEYAARGGTSTRHYWGDGQAEACRHANVLDGGFYSGEISFACEDGQKWSSPVGSFQPNPFGLYDMLGNVWEWTGDWTEFGYYGKSPRTNPPGPSVGSERVFRGGSWINTAANVRSAFRIWNAPDYRGSNLGLRLALSVHQP